MQSSTRQLSLHSRNLRILCAQHIFLLIAGSLSLGLYTSWAVLSDTDGAVTVYHLWMVAALASALCIAVWNDYRCRSQTIPFSLLLAFAIAFRLVGIGAFPVLEDDFYRFLWDGRIFVTMGSPYDLIPEDFFDRDFGASYNWILGQINYPDIATVYGPSAQWVFALSYIIAPGEVWPLQLLIASADILLIVLLRKFTSTNNVLLYAWCPLVIKETVFSVHFDGIGVCLLIAAWLCCHRNRFYFAGALLAMAAGVKVFALVAIPFFLRFRWRGWLAFLGGAILISLPFGILPAWLPSGLQAMNTQWLFNAPLYSLLLNAFSYSTVKVLLQGVFILVWACYLTRQLFFADSWQHPRLDWVFAGLLLCIPALNPWYLLWLLPFAVINPSRWAWMSASCVLLAYAIGLNLPEQELSPYEQLPLTMLIEFSLIAFAVFLDLRSRANRATPSS